MNSYPLTSRSSRRRLPSAAAVTVVAGVVAAVLAAPASSSAVPIEPTRYAAANVVSPAPTTDGHPCYLEQFRWNEALNGPQPVCGTETTEPADDTGFTLHGPGSQKWMPLP